MGSLRSDTTLASEPTSWWASAPHSETPETIKGWVDACAAPPPTAVDAMATALTRIALFRIIPIMLPRMITESKSLAGRLRA